MTSRLAASATLLVVALLAPALPSARAEGPAPVEKGGVFPDVEEVPKDEDAKAILDALDAAVESKDEAKVLEAVKPMVTKRHKSFGEELRKLAADKRILVAAAAAEALGSQGEDKASAAALVRIVQAKTKEKGFYKDLPVKCAAIESLGRLGIKTAADAILDLAEDQRREPTILGTGQAKLVRACVRYFGLAKEKRAVSYLIEEVDQPVPKDPTSGTNPGPDYWKKRHDTWVVIRPDVLWALKEITGLEQETARRWRKWFEEEGKKGGFK